MVEFIYSLSNFSQFYWYTFLALTFYFHCHFNWNITAAFSSIVASRIRYEITRGNFGGAFAVKNMTGAIYVAGPLDYETRRRVSLLTKLDQSYSIKIESISYNKTNGIENVWDIQFQFQLFVL